MRKWRIEDSAELYNINGWGLKYFSINDKGHVAVTPREGSASVDLKELMDELQVRDVTSPVLLRFQQAADEYGYTAKTSSSTPSRSTKCDRWWKRSSVTVKNSTSAWKRVPNPNCMLYWQSTPMKTRSSSVTDTKMRTT